MRFSSILLVAGSQVVILGINAVTGLWLVRALPQQEYAWLTILNSVVAAYGFLLEPLVGPGLQSSAGTYLADETAYAGVMRAAWETCVRWMGLLSLFWLPWGAYLMVSTGAGAADTVVCGVLVCMSLPLLMVMGIRGMRCRLEGHAEQLQKVELAAGALRLAFSAGLVWMKATAVMAGLAALLSQVPQLLMTRQIGWKGRLWSAEALNTLVTGRLQALIRGTLPHGFFQCFQTQIGVWILSLYGSAGAVAEVGALGRFAVLTAPLTSVFHQMVIPRFAILDGHQARKKLAVKSFCLLMVCGGLLVLTVWWLPGPFLWLLGPKYAHLSSELPLAVLFFSLSTAQMIVWWFNAARAGVELARWTPWVSLAACVVSVWLLRPADAHGTLLFMTAPVACALVLGLVQAAKNLRKSNEPVR